MLYTEIPTQRPVTPLLDGIDHPQQLRQLEQSQLAQVADELRQYILYAAGQSGGHFGANLGVFLFFRGSGSERPSVLILACSWVRLACSLMSVR